jgi:drug/metabolite transporter (DMT)-like permease
VLTARRPDRRTLAAFAVTVAVGGVNSIAVRINLRELTPFWGAAFRFVIASVVLAGIVLVFRRRRPARADLLGIGLFGLFNFGLTYVFLYTGLREAPAGTTSVITALVPLLTLIFAVLQGVERFRPAGLLGSLIAVAGIALIFANQMSLDVPIRALLALVGAAACIAETGVLVKRFPPGDPLIAVSLAVPIGAIFLAILSALVGEPWIIPSRPETWATIAYLVVFGSIVIFSLTLFVLQHWTASATSYAFLLSPLVSIILGALILGEKVQPAFVAGGALVLAGVYVGAVFRPPRRRSSSEPDGTPVADNSIDQIPAAH